MRSAVPQRRAVRKRAPAQDRAERLLLVDDREDNILALRAVLEPLGYEILTATSGADALRTLLETDASAIVLDVQMPDMDGFETATLLKSREATRSIPIVFLTAVGVGVEHELRGYDVGAFDYVCKPFEPRVLQAKVRAAVRSNAELRALREANLTYREATEALASLGAAAGAVVRWPTSRDGAPFVTARVLDVALEATVVAPSAARAAVRGALAGQPAEWADTVVLLVSELLANAVLHARSASRLRVDLGEAFARVEVEDAGSSLPDPSVPKADDEDGRGLFMLERLADRCGWNRVPGGKLVWFELARN
jgi:CheY-like chemotaxis protein/anti-sigma regulatory factor (Ser/Thr protein kinase)